MNFQEAKVKAEKLTPTKVNNDFFNFIKSIQKELADLNRIALNEDSQDVYGKAIGFYSKATEEISGGRKQEGTPFTLYDEGVFLPTIYARVDNDSIFFGATDPKLDDIFTNLLSRDIFGLRDEDLEKVIAEKFSPFFLEYFYNELT